jgi:hypothetical protein
MTTAATDWEAKCKRELMAALDKVRAALERFTQTASVPAEELQFDYAAEEGGRIILPAGYRSFADEQTEPSALERLCKLFQLSEFEKSILLLCAGMEVRADFAALCASGHGDPRMNYPTFSLALAVFQNADWKAFAPSSRLRRWRLIEVARGERVTASPIKIDERVLHYLCGISYLDERLQGLIEPCIVRAALPESQRAGVIDIANAWSDNDDTGSVPVIQISGNDSTGQRSVVAAACTAFGLHLHTMRSVDLPSSAVEREAFARLWEREALLSDCALLIEDAGANDSASLVPFLETTQAFLLVTSSATLRTRSRRILRVEVNRPSAGEQKAIWKQALGPAVEQLNGQLDLVATQFDLSLQSINEASQAALSRSSETELGDALWNACRRQARPGLDDLAQRISPAATWKDLVLPPAHLEVLRSIATHVRWRALVYEGWGFAGKGLRGLSISALFSGASGTGKTMAAEVLANELRLDLYRIDLSAIVSKYIGETEKNLRRVFDAAEEGGAILLFDEADALFGKRSEVKDSHDRYANIEVSYLLQRIEAYRGLAILTSNLKNALDPAFMRRIRFIVHFPFPDSLQRVEIWRRIFPDETPTEALNLEKLAQLNLSGGNIRNLALGAAFFAADAGEPVRMKHLAAAARGEYAKLEKPLSEADLRGWL